MIYNKSLGDKVFDKINVLLMIIIAFLTIYPFWYALVGSLNTGNDYLLGGVYFWPRKFTLDNYIAVFRQSEIMGAYQVTLARTVLGTAAHIIFTGLFAYGFSRKNLMGKEIYAKIGLITMFFGGGLIPHFLLVKSLGLLNRFEVYIVLHLFSFFNVLIFQSFFRGIPDEINESAKIDGAGEYRIFFWLIVPLSMPVIAAIALFQGVGHWNSFFDAMIYAPKKELQTVQVYMMKLIISSDEAAKMAKEQSVYKPEEETVNSRTIQLATMMVTTGPILILYPFLQKYFVKGMMIGSVKG